MDGLNVVIHQQSQSLRETMINFGHLVEDVQQFLIGGAAAGYGFTYGDHALPMTTECRQPLINLPDVLRDRVGQIMRRVFQFTSDV